MAEPTPIDIFVVPEDEKLILTGPPSSLAGRVALHNPGDVNVVVREAGVKDAKGVLISKPKRRTMPTLVLRPNQARNIPLKFTLDANTPPGEYQVELDVAGRSRSAVLHVTEMFDVRIQPNTVVVANLADQVQKKRLIVTNQGNVAFTIGDLGAVDLKDDMIWDRALRLALESTVDKADVDIEELVVALHRVARKEAFRLGSLLVNNLSGKVKVLPGETATIDLELTLQEELPPNSRFRGVMPLLTQDLEIIVVSSSDPVESEPPAKPVRTARKTTRRTTTRKRRTTK